MPYVYLFVTQCECRGTCVTTMSRSTNYELTKPSFKLHGPSTAASRLRYQIEQGNMVCMPPKQSINVNTKARRQLLEAKEWGRFILFIFPILPVRFAIHVHIKYQYGFLFKSEINLIQQCKGERVNNGILPGTCLYPQQWTRTAVLAGSLRRNVASLAYTHSTPRETIGRLRGPRDPHCECPRTGHY